MSMKIERRMLDFDYSEYLGKDYKQTQIIPKYVPSFISNHVSWSDIIVYIN